MRHFRVNLTLSLLLLSFSSCKLPGIRSTEVKRPPNILLIMTDDQGWFDAGFNGNTRIKTPNADHLASQGVILSRFYAASAVCSPTRASVLTGRNPYRIGVPGANQGHLDDDEITLAEALKERGYRTGHFGKWHLGTFTTKEKDANRGGRPEHRRHFTVPADHGYDVYFSTESKVPTYDPMVKPVRFNENESLRNGWLPRTDSSQTLPYGTSYWRTGAGVQKAVDNLQGDDSKLIMDRVIDFIGASEEAKQPFFSTIWFHAPHLPVVAGETYRRQYPGIDLFEQNYFGAITSMDDQLGRLWRYLEETGEAENTIIFYCSDNGPEERTPGSAGNFRADKRDLYEGGVRVPAFVIWKSKLKGGRTVEAPMVTSDYFPTILEALDIELPKDREYDGKSVWGLIGQKESLRNKPIGFIYDHKQSWVTDRYKLISTDEGKTYELYDLKNDPYEKNDLITTEPALARQMKADLDAWLEEIRREKRTIEAGWK